MLLIDQGIGLDDRLERTVDYDVLCGVLRGIAQERPRRPARAPLEWAWEAAQARAVAPAPGSVRHGPIG